MKYDIEKLWSSQSPSIPLLARHHSLYAVPVNKMPSFCTMTNNAIYFHLNYTVQTIINRHCHGDLLNQRVVISPRTFVLHACLLPKQQYLTTLALGEKTLIPYSLKGLPFWFNYMED